MLVGGREGPGVGGVGFGRESDFELKATTSAASASLLLELPQ